VLGRLKPQLTESDSELHRAPKKQTGQRGNSGNVGINTSTQAARSSRSWLLPHQTFNREEGGKMAAAVNSARTPIGGFAGFDLAKALK
jgi:hypothetical protein